MDTNDGIAGCLYEDFVQELKDTGKANPEFYLKNCPPGERRELHRKMMVALQEERERREAHPPETDGPAGTT